MPGGRPRNLWTAARERKLARLYTLSNLKLEEIQSLLKADGFNPCTRDIQKKLGTLLSKDYSRKYHKFRPANHDDARIRLSHLKKCTQHRIRKRRADGARPRAQLQDSNRGNVTEAKSNHEPNSSSQLHSALIDYSVFQSYESLCVTPGLLSIQPGFLPLHPLGMAGTGVDACQGQARAENVIPGSNLAINELETAGLDKKPCVSHAIEPAYLHNNATRGQHTLASPSVEGTSPMSDFPGSQSSTVLSRNSPSVQIAQIIKPLTRKSSADSLLKLLGRRYSDETLEHIKSILCYSSTNSRRSSLVSSLSFGSSWKSKISIQVGRSSFKASRSSTSIENPWTEIDQTIWGELVDEERLVHPLHRRLHCAEISLAGQSRPCCASMSTTPCGVCGTSEAHTLVLWGLLQNPMEWPLWLPSKDQLNAKDNFNNTPLHFAAASGKARLLLLVFLIEEGADIRAKNTSGETFMHVLDQRSLGGMRNLCRLLRVLNTRSFPFSDRDYHGRTIAHALFSDIDVRDIPTDIWKQILSIVKPDFFSLDNLGLDVRGRPRQHNSTTKGWPENKLKSWPDIFERIAPIPPQLALASSEVTQRIKDWTALVTTFNHVTWVDVNGDTLLTSLIKRWPDQHEGWLLERLVNQLISLGAEINMRERRGYTALAIAVRRGFTLTSTALLRAGANVNSRNYDGKGILSLAKESLRQARRSDMALYAKVLSCMNSIIDDGAKGDPTAYDEFMSREATAKQPKAKREYELGEWFTLPAV